MDSQTNAGRAAAALPFVDALAFLDETTVAPVPFGSLRLWAVELHGAMLGVKRAWPRFAADLEDVRTRVVAEDPAMSERAEAFERDAETVAHGLDALLGVVERLTHERRPNTATESTVVARLRDDVLGWIRDVHEVRREHETWRERRTPANAGG